MSECCSWLAKYFPEECLKRTTVARENKCELRLKESEDSCLLHVDGCWFTSNDFRKCDYILFCFETKRAFLAELKGNKFEEAEEQLVNVYMKLPEEVKDFFVFTACVISSKVKVTKSNSNLNKIKANIRKKIGIKLVVQSQKYIIQ